MSPVVTVVQPCMSTLGHIANNKMLHTLDAQNQIFLRESSLQNKPAVKQEAVSLDEHGCLLLLGGAHSSRSHIERVNSDLKSLALAL